MNTETLWQWAAIGLLVGAVWVWNLPTVKAVRFRHQAKRGARSVAQQLLARSSEWVVVDTETTGLKENDVVLSIAVVDSDGQVVLDTLVALPPRKRISAGASSAHGITREALKGAPVWSEVRGRLDRVVSGRQCLAYNASFDERLIEQTDLAHGVQGHAFRWVDVMPVYNAWVFEYDPRRRKTKWQKLPGGDHTARGDCLAVLSLLRKMAA